MPDTSDVLLRKVPTNFVENFQNKATLAEKKSMRSFQDMADDIATGSLSLYRCGDDAGFPRKLAAALAISGGHIAKTTFWKMRLGSDLYVMTYGTPTGIPDVDGAHATGTNFTEDNLVDMLDAADVNRDMVTVQEAEIVGELRRQVAAHPDVKHSFTFSARNMRRLGPE